LPPAEDYKRKNEYKWYNILRKEARWGSKTVKGGPRILEIIWYKEDGS
jgi:hypothetical protein